MGILERRAAEVIAGIHQCAVAKQQPDRRSLVGVGREPAMDRKHRLDQRRHLPEAREAMKASQ